MSTFDWPDALVPQSCSMPLRKAGLQFQSPFNGTVQALDFVAERWVLSANLAQMSSRNPRGVGALLNQLAGGINRVRAWPFHTKGVPRGTLRGTPTLGTAGARGDVTLTLTGCVALSTLLADDYVGAGGQLFQVAADCAADGAGAMTVPLVNRVRGTIASGSAVTWNKPTAEFMLPAMQAGPVFRPGAIDGTALDLVEVW